MTDAADGSSEPGRPSPLARARRVPVRPAPASASPAPKADTAAVPADAQNAGTTESDGESASVAAVDGTPRRGRRGRRTSVTTLRSATSTRVAERSAAAEAEAVIDGAEPAEPIAGGQDQAPKTSRAGRNLPAAIGVGVGLGGLIIASLFVYRPSFAVIVGLAVLYGTYELSKAFSAAHIKISLGPLLVGAIGMLIAAWERGTNGLAVAALVTLAGVLVWRIADGAAGYTRDAAASALALLYVPTLAGFAVLLVHPHDGAARVIFFVATVVCSDTGGYTAGVLFGKHPLAPVVSKAKTWEGFSGSVLACSTAGILIMMFTFHHSWWKGLLFGLAMAVTATLGDLGESMIKRDLGLKDMGTLLPGHGGIMDRLDSLLPCAAVAYLILSALAPV